MLQVHSGNLYGRHLHVLQILYEAWRVCGLAPSVAPIARAEGLSRITFSLYTVEKISVCLINIRVRGKCITVPLYKFL